MMGRSERAGIDGALEGAPLVIERVELFALSMPLVGDFATSFGRVATREMVLVALHAGGLSGWGEASVASRPHYSPETTETALHVLRDWMAPALLGGRFAALAEVDRAIGFVRGHHMARSAIGFAFLDLIGRAHGRSLAELLGATRDAVPVGVSLGIPKGAAVEALLDTVAARLEDGYRRVKVKVEPGFGGRALEAVRARWPELRLAADANGGFDLARDHEELRALDRYGLCYLEQPLAPYDLCQHARLARSLSTPICLDESIEGPDDLESALALGALGILNLKPGRVGGPARALAMADTCAAHGVPLWCGGMLETGVGRAACVALAATPAFTLEHDLSASARYYAHDIVEPAFVLAPDSTLAVPSGPGLGVEVIRERVERFATARVALEARPAVR